MKWTTSPLGPNMWATQKPEVKGRERERERERERAQIWQMAIAFSLWSLDHGLARLVGFLSCCHRVLMCCTCALLSYKFQFFMGSS